MSPTAGDGTLGEGALVEEFGLRIGQSMGWPPMAGRTAGVLMLSEQPLTLGQLQQALQASKGSMSEMTRLLMVNGTVERIKEPGSRQFVYRWRDDAWVGCLQHQLQATTQLLRLAESAQEPGTHLPDVQRARLREMQDYYAFMARQLDSLLAEYTTRWKAGQAGQTERRDRPAASPSS